MRQIVRRYLARAREALKDAHQAELTERSLMIQAATAAFVVRARDRLSHLSDAGFRISSQWGEDGIIEWLVSHLPGIPESFIEFGATNYQEANTRFLLQHRNWRGLIADGDAAELARIADDCFGAMI